MKTCPFCRAEAPDDAQTCGACGKSFDQPDAVPESQGAAAGPPAYGLAPEAIAKESAPSAEARTGDELGLTACPQCKTDWEPGAVVCMTCGYDARTGRQLSTVRGVEDEPVIRQTAGLGPVRTGLMLHAIRMGVLFVALLIAFFTGVIAVQITNGEDFAPHAVKLPQENKPPPEPGDDTHPAPAPVDNTPEGPDYKPALAALILSWVVFGLALLQPLLGIIGSVQCLRAPPQTRTRPLIIASLAWDGVALVAAAVLLGWACWQAPSSPLDPSKPPAATVLAAWPLRLATLPVLAAWALFLLFAGRMAAFYERTDEASQTVSLIISGLIVLLAMPLLLAPFVLDMIGWLGRDLLGAIIAYIITSVFGIGWFAFGFWNVYQVFGVTNSVRDALAPKPADKEAAPAPQSG